MAELEFCGRCRFWEFFHPGREGEPAQGECRRHAPRPTSQTLHEIGTLAGRAAWAVEETAKIEHDEQQDYLLEGVDQFEIHEWPITKSYDWCGEFDRREGDPVIRYRAAQMQRVDAAVQWEKAIKLEEKYEQYRKSKEEKS